MDGAPLLERRAEVDALREAVAHACAGRTRVVVVRGPAGSGRTRLLDVADGLAAAHDVLVLRAGGGTRHPGRSPFALARDLLRRSAAGPTTDAAVLLRDAARRARTGGAAGTDVAAMLGLVRSVARLTAESPVVLLADDLDRADPESVRWLAHLAHQADGLPLLVVGSVHSAPGAGPTARALDELVSAPGVGHLAPAPLSRDAVRSWLHAAAVVPAHPEVLDACVGATGGNPALVARVVQRLAHPAPVTDAVDRIHGIGAALAVEGVSAVLRDLPPEEIALAHAVAVLGEDTMPRVVALVAELDDVAVDRAAARLSALGILDRDGRRFRHAAARTAVLGTLSDDRRCRLRAWAGRVLESEGAPPERVAVQFLDAGPPADRGVVELLHGAACRARQRGAPKLAASFLVHALRGNVPDRTRAALLLDLGITERHSAPVRAHRHLTRALSLSGSARERARVITLLVAFHTGPDAEGLVGLLERGLRDLAAAVPESGPEPPGDRDLRLGLEALLLYASAEDSTQMAAVRDWVDRTDPHTLGSGAGASALRSAHVFYSTLLLRTDAAESAVLARGALDGALDESEALQPIRMGALGVLAWTEADDTLAPLHERALADARTQQRPELHASLRGVRSMLHLRCGRVPEAFADARASLDVLTGELSGETRLMILHCAVLALIELGEVNEAAALVHPANLEGTSDRSWRWSWLLDARAAVLAARGRPREALAQAQEAGRRLRNVGIVNPAALGWQGRTALLHHELGEHAAARAVALEHLGLARRWGTHGHVGAALRVLGVVQGAGEGLRTLQDAAAELARSPRVLDSARCLVDLGVMARETGDEAQARVLLREGLDLAEGCGARMLSTRALSELTAAGGRGRRRSGGGSLTPAELDVARLAAAGASNRDVAASLGVSRRAVELHLTRCYRKLDIPGRAELAGALRRRVLQSPGEAG